MTGLLIIPILAILIILHELGHFFAARSVGVTVEEFGIGIPPKFRAWRWKGVQWSLNYIPFGGFVRVKGEDGADMSPGSMNAVGPLKRGWFLLAGPLMNFVTAIVLCFILVGVQGTPSTDEPLYIGNVAPESPAERAGWLPGDQIVAVDGTRFEDSSDIVDAINAHVGQETTVTIQRGGDVFDTHVTPRTDPPAGEGATGIGIGDGRLSTIRVSSLEPGSVADKAGLQEGDQIIAVNGIQVQAWEQAIGLLNGAQGQDATITVKRAGQSTDITVPIPALTIHVQSVESGSPASDAMLYDNDRIVSINKQPTTDAPSFAKAVRDNAGTTAPITIERTVNGQHKTLVLAIAIPDMPEDKADFNPQEMIGITGLQDSAPNAIGLGLTGSLVYEDVPLRDVPRTAWDQFWFLIDGTFNGLRHMVTQGVDPDQLAGPVGMGQLTSELIAESPEPMWVILVNLSVMISVSLGVLNLLPFPALDGGRLLFVLIELLRGGKRVAPEKEGLVHLAGMVLLLGLMFYIAFGDVLRIVDGRSILP